MKIWWQSLHLGKMLVVSGRKIFIWILLFWLKKIWGQNLYYIFVLVTSKLTKKRNWFRIVGWAYKSCWYLIVKKVHVRCKIFIIAWGIFWENDVKIDHRKEYHITLWVFLGWFSSTSDIIFNYSAIQVCNRWNGSVVASLLYVHLCISIYYFYLLFGNAY